MQISPLRIQHNIPIPHIGPGTGKYNKMEVYPTTQTLLRKLRLEPSESLLKEQNKRLEELPYIGIFKFFFKLFGGTH